MVKKIIGVLVGAFILYTFYFLWYQAREEPVIYNLVSPRTGMIENTVTATGKLEPRTEINVKPKITGTIKTLDVVLGQNVKQGQLLATVQITPDQSMLSSAKSAIKIATVALDKAELEYNRCKNLFEKKVVSKRELELSESALKDAKESLDAHLSIYNVAKNGYDLTSGNITEVRSPIDGVVMDIPTKVGAAVVSTNNFSEGTTVAVVAQMDDIIFKGTIDETNASELRSGQEMYLTIGNMKERRIDGRLEIVSPRGKSQNGTIQFEVRATVEIPDDIIVRAGYSANAEFIVEKKENALIIDEGCIEYEGNKTFVQVLTSKPEKEKNQKFERREVVLGVSNGIDVEILSGIDKETKLRGLQKQ